MVYTYQDSQSYLWGHGLFATWTHDWYVVKSYELITVPKDQSRLSTSQCSGARTTNIVNVVWNDFRQFKKKLVKAICIKIKNKKVDFSGTQCIVTKLYMSNPDVIIRILRCFCSHSCLKAVDKFLMRSFDYAWIWGIFYEPELYSASKTHLSWLLYLNIMVRVEWSLLKTFCWSNLLYMKQPFYWNQ